MMEALWDAIRECVWLRRVCKEFNIEQLDSTVIDCDSQIAIRLTEEHCESGYLLIHEHARPLVDPPVHVPELEMELHAIPMAIRSSPGVRCSDRKREDARGRLGGARQPQKSLLLPAAPT